MSDRDSLRRLGILAMLASAGEIGVSLPNLIAGMKLLTAEQVMDGLSILRRKGCLSEVPDRIRMAIGRLFGGMPPKTWSFR